MIVGSQFFLRHRVVIQNVFVSPLLRGPDHHAGPLPQWNTNSWGYDNGDQKKLMQRRYLDSARRFRIWVGFWNRRRYGMHLWSYFFTLLVRSSTTGAPTTTVDGLWTFLKRNQCRCRNPQLTNLVAATKENYISKYGDWQHRGLWCRYWLSRRWVWNFVWGVAHCQRCSTTFKNLKSN